MAQQPEPVRGLICALRLQIPKTAERIIVVCPPHANQQAPTGAPTHAYVSQLPKFPRGLLRQRLQEHRHAAPTLDPKDRLLAMMLVTVSARAVGALY